MTTTTRDRFALATVALTVALLATLALIRPAMADGGSNLPNRTSWMVRACQTEDSVNCQWNAQIDGNGKGHSFYVVARKLENVHGKRVGRVTCVYYIARADRKFDACHIQPAHH